jgi:hypothetical protein
LVAAVAGLIVLAVGWSIWRAWRGRDDHPLLIVLAAGLPVVGAALLFLVRPMFEERYLIVAAPACLALVAIGASAIGRLFRPIGLLGLAWLTLATWPFLDRYYESIAGSRPDWRGLARSIAAHEREGDVVLITGQGVADAYSYYGRGAAPVVVADTAVGVDAAVDRLVASGTSGAFVLPYWDAPADLRASERLREVGFAEPTHWFGNQRRQYFALARAGDPAPRQIGATWRGSIELARASVAPTQVERGEAIRVQVEWRARAAAPDLKVSLRLLRPDTGSVAQLDRRPLDEARPFPSIGIGEAVRDGYALRLPEDLAPGPYLVALLLYEPEGARAIPPDPGAHLAPASPDLVLLGELVIDG